MGTQKPAFGEIAISGSEPLFPASTRYGNLLFLSGQAPIDPITTDLCAPGFVEQASFVMNRIAETLACAGAGLGAVLRVECILANAEYFAAWNKVFADFFSAPRPVRTTFVGSFVIPGMLLEVQVTAGAS